LGLFFSASCKPERPKCGAAGVKLADYRIASAGIAGKGFQAILGIGIGSDRDPNPLLEAGAKRWIIEVPEIGSKAPGRLILNPDDKDLFGFYFSSLSLHSSQLKMAYRSSIDGCLIARKSGERLCGPILFDTGSTSLDLMIEDDAKFARFHNARYYTLEFGEGKQKLSWQFEALARAVAQLTPEHAGAQPGQILISAGMPPCIHFRVLYDYERDTIALKPR
jgi:hypothetical protein